MFVKYSNICFKAACMCLCKRKKERGIYDFMVLYVLLSYAFIDLVPVYLNYWIIEMFVFGPSNCVGGCHMSMDIWRPC